MTAWLSIVLSLTLLVLGVGGPALEIHHALAPADHDGHQHSDNDLCKWVQAHTGCSLTSTPAPLRPLLQSQCDIRLPTVALLSPRFTAQLRLRGPPLS